MTNRIAHKYADFRKLGVGGWVGHEAESCLRLAKAEAWAEDEGLAVAVDDSFEPWDGDCEAPEYLFDMRLVRPCPDHGTSCRHAETLASLGKIGVNDPNDPYLRICAAELALEAQPV